MKTPPSPPTPFGATHNYVWIRGLERDCAKYIQSQYSRDQVDVKGLTWSISSNEVHSKRLRAAPESREALLKSTERIRELTGKRRGSGDVN